MKRRVFSRFMALLLGCIVMLNAIADDLVVIDLRNRTAEEVIPSLRPLVSADVALSGIDYKLIVRGDASEVAKIREVLAVLDRTPRQLLISVRYIGSPQNRTNDSGANADVDKRNTQITVRGGITSGTATDSNVSSVRVLEGNAAHISSGQSVPFVSAVFVPMHHKNRRSGVGIVTDYREISSGFDVVPRVNADRVVLEISAQQERLLDSSTGSASVQRASTTIAGRLGEWIDLGGVASSLDEQRTSIGVAGGGRHVTTRSDQKTIAVKVEQVE